MPTKLIEVALPLTAINEATAAEKRKTARLAHPAKVHQWWARRPLAACRAILFAQLVDDPGPGPERERLFEIIRMLVRPEGPKAEALEAAQSAIRECVGDDITVLDPFAGGGAIPIEAQRLGLHVEASDLNPVAVLLNRLVLDQISSGLDRSPVRPVEGVLATTRPSGLAGLAEDIEYYGHVLRTLASNSLSSHYPSVTAEDGTELPVVAWMWARTVPCPNPMCQRPAPLLSTFWLSRKKKRAVWIEPKVGARGEAIEFLIRTSNAPPTLPTGSKVGRGAKFVCLGCDQPMESDYIKASGCQGNMRFQLLCVVGLGDRQRVYLPATEDQVAASLVAAPEVLDTDLAEDPRAIWVRGYGMTTHRSLFTPRQLASLNHLMGLMPQVRQQVVVDSGGDETYADLITTVLAVAVSKLADSNNTVCRWLVKDEVPVNLFARQAIPMSWDFPEANILGESSGSLKATIANVARSLCGELLGFERDQQVVVRQANAATREYPDEVVVCTDPPYFDNIGYADLADFFYVWLRLGLQSTQPDLFESMLTPKAEELVVVPYRFEGGKSEAASHFENGFRDVFKRIKQRHHPEIPLALFYAYKQEDAEVDDQSGGSGAGATGWETLLQGLVDSSFQITATWPIRTEMTNRMIGMGTNSLASSVVLSCRARPADAGVTDRQGFIRHLRRELHEKLGALQSGGVQPVDLAQASIGPGMAVFTSYSRVVEAGDQSMSVGAALQAINQVLDELQSEQEGDLDPYTRWAVTWFDQFGMNAGDFGDAQNIATARGTAMNAIERSGIVESRAGRVRLLDRSEYPDDWDPTTDKTLTVWEICQHIIRRLDGDGGVPAAAELLRQSGGLAESARDLSYRLYEIANRRGWAEEARGYNNMATEWPGLVAAAAQSPSDSTTLF